MGYVVICRMGQFEVKESWRRDGTLKFAAIALHSHVALPELR